MASPTDVLRVEHVLILRALNLLEAGARREMPDGWWAGAATHRHRLPEARKPALDELHLDLAPEQPHHTLRRRMTAVIVPYVADSLEQARAEFAEPVIWYYRTIAKYVAPPRGQAPIKSYEMYAKTRDLAATATWEEFLARKAVICGDPDGSPGERTPALGVGKEHVGVPAADDHVLVAASALGVRYL